MRQSQSIILSVHDHQNPQVRGRRIHCRQISNRGHQASLADLEDFSPQSCQSDCCHRLFYRSDRHLSQPVLLYHSFTRPPEGPALQCHGSSNCHLGGAADCGGFPRRYCSTFSCPGSGSDLRRRVPTPSERGRIEEVLTAPRSPWQNAYAERLIGSIRRECFDHLIILNEDHLRRILREYIDYYNHVRPHQALERNSPASREIEPVTKGKVFSILRVGGLHHE